VVQRVTDGQEDRSLCGPVIHDIRKLADFFTSCFFRHVYRSINVVAHSLAKSSEFSVCHVWRGVIPDCIREIICNDLFLIM
jgi:hypothetical protein